MPNFLHGVETLEITTGPRPVRVVKSAVIGIIGTSHYGSKNTPVLIQSLQDVANKLGPAMKEFTLAKHCELILRQGAGTIIAVNVYNSAEHTSEVEEETVTIGANGKFTTALQMAPGFPVTLTSLDGNTTYESGPNDDYTWNSVTSTFTILNPSLLETPNTQLKVSYTRHALSLVPEADVIGGIAEDNDRTGLKVFDLCKNTFGFSPKIFLAPVFCETNTMKDQLLTVANTFRGRALIDAPISTTLAEVVAGRGPLGTINFNTSSKRAVLCYPHFEVDFAWGEEVIGLSTFLAGAWVKTINDFGYWYSPSNKEFVGAKNPTEVLSGDINNAQTDANLLNENGVVTYLAAFGTGYRTWGNRSAAWPTNTAPENFLSVQLTADVIHESIELAMLPFIDQPLTDGLIDSIKETVNAFIKTLIQRGALLVGSECLYDPANNPPTQLALGQVVFDIVMMPPVPAERITFQSFIDINLLSSLGAEQ
jgi:phage tail sheath protein FI